MSSEAGYQRPDFSTDLVQRLVARQFPQWSGLPVRPVSPQGWDNRTFRLGNEFSVRLPSAEHYVPQVDKEHRWLPILGPQLSKAIPEPIAKGAPGSGFPFPWSVYRWLEGHPADQSGIEDFSEVAQQLAIFLSDLRSIDTKGRPPAGQQNFYRGGSLSVMDRATRKAIALLQDEINASLALEIWERALAQPWQLAPVWVHGDIAPGNLLISRGELGAVIDFGCLGVGDPACDLAIAWSFFDGKSREKFLTGLSLDPATVDRAKGWALWKAVITLSGLDSNQRLAGYARKTMAALSLTRL